MERSVTVTELNDYLKAVMDGDGNLKMLCVEGEISGFVAHSSGHYYFTLKDGASATFPYIRGTAFTNSMSRECCRPVWERSFWLMRS